MYYICIIRERTFKSMSQSLGIYRHQRATEYIPQSRNSNKYSYIKDWIACQNTKQIVQESWFIKSGTFSNYFNYLRIIQGAYLKQNVIYPTSILVNNASEPTFLTSISKLLFKK